MNKRNKLLANIAFIALSAILLTFLLRAPAETTAKLPSDDEHSPFFTMGKKEAESHCQSCHNEDEVQFPADHPDKNRCLFCHKRQ
ncbi:MAG: hypothetical protein ABFR97_08400 [Thermodesulfobacteriota bacterium]